MARIIGIDLGTTNTLAAYWDHGRCVLIPNRFGNLITPSVVSFDGEGNVFVGELAKERQIIDPQNTFACFKRSMGSDRNWNAYGQNLKSEDFSAILLRAIKADAEAFLGEEVNEAVISVPAYFGDAARKATRNAGLIAGLKVDRIVNEPSAAAFACRRMKNTKDGKMIVFDFGGGTLDVSLVDCFENIVEIIAVSGNNHLGGIDFDMAIAKHFCKSNGISFDSLDFATQEVIVRASEQAKRELTIEQTACVDVVSHAITASMSISRKELIQISRSVLEQIAEPVRNVLANARVSVKDIVSVVLVGGSCKMPIVQQYLQFLLKGVPQEVINPDHMVALGAGAYAGAKENGDAARDIILTDICPFSLGTAVHNPEEPSKPFMSVIIPRNSALPCSRSQSYIPVSPISTEQTIEVYQGEDMYAMNNQLLGNLKIEGLPVGADAIRSHTIRFTYDINGILLVKATLDCDGKEFDLVLGADTTDDEIIERIKKLHDLQEKAGANDESTLLKARAERIYKQLTSANARAELMENMTAFAKTLDENDAIRVRKTNRAFTQYLNEVEKNELKYRQLRDPSLDDFLSWYENQEVPETSGTENIVYINRFTD